MLVSGRYISHWTAIPFVVFNESLVLAICSPLNQNSASGLYRDKKNKGCLHSLKNNCSLHSRVQPKNRPEPSSSPTISGVNFWKLKLPKQCINASNLLERITSSKTHQPYFLQGCDWGPEFPFKHSTRITNTWLIRFLQQKKTSAFDEAHELKGSSLLFVHQVSCKHHGLQIDAGGSTLHAHTGICKGDCIYSRLTLKFNQHFEKGLRILDVLQRKTRERCKKG